MKKYQKNFKAKPHKFRPPQQEETDWNQVAKWYDALVGEKGSEYQQEVIFPNALKLMQLKPQETVLDLACGQGAFCRELLSQQCRILGVDASPELIRMARTRSSSEISFFIQNVLHVSQLSLPPIDVIVCLLAIQNMNPLEKVFAECAKILKPQGRLVFVMTHPCFRVPRQTHWGFLETQSIQYRRVDMYLSELKIPIIAHPGKDPDLYTWSFHRPLQSYIQALAQAGFWVDGMEELISHKTSLPGPKARAENRARQEIPLFLALRARKINT